MTNNKTVQVDISVGTSIIGVFERIEIDTLHAFCEFIDNSLQSYKENKDRLLSVGTKRCTVSIDWGNDEIRIEDNAYGMDLESFGRALRLNAPKNQYDEGSLSKYGMGLKYAAINLGNVWTIRSTMLDSTEEYQGEIDADDLILHNVNKVEVVVLDTQKERHHTIITIKKLKRTFFVKEQDDIIKKLAIIYETFLSNNSLEIIINNIKVKYYDPEYREDVHTGAPYYRLISNGKFLFRNKIYEYTASIGILKTASVKDAGLRLRQNDRVINLSYRPSELFGQGNDYRYQRVIGNVDFIGNDWVVKVNKDGMAWGSKDFEKAFIEDLESREEVKSIMATAKTLRKDDVPYYTVTVSCNNANVVLDKTRYKSGDKVSFSVKAHPGFEVKLVSVNEKILIPTSEHENAYSFEISEDFSKDPKIKVKTSAIIDWTPPFNDKPQSPPLPTPGGKKDGPTISENPIETTEEYIKKLLSKLSEYDFPIIPEKGEIFRDGIIIKTKKADFSFLIREKEDHNFAEWFHIKDKRPFVRSYELTINYSAGVLSDLTTNENGRKIVVVFAILTAFSRIITSTKGVSWTDSGELINSLNDLINIVG